MFKHIEEVNKHLEEGAKNEGMSVEQYIDYLLSSREPEPEETFDGLMLL